MRVDTVVAPQPIAEVIAPEIAIEAVRHYETRRTPAGLLHSAWVHTEYALNQSCPPGAAPHFMETAHMLLGNIINRGELVGDQEVHEDTTLHALVLATYMPLFVARKEKVSVASKDCRMVYQSLGRALQYLQPLTIDEPPQWRMMEAAVLALSARIGRPELLLYPASPREESSEVEVVNHDSYFHVANNKLPIQQKLLPTQHEYDEAITVLTLEPLITKALKATGEYARVEGWTASDKVNLLLSRIIAETSGEQLYKEEARFLNVLTQAVAAHHADLAGRRDTGALRRAA